jgi:hypothetical protein
MPLDWSPIHKQLVESFSAEETILGKAIIDIEHADSLLGIMDMALGYGK